MYWILPVAAAIWIAKANNKRKTKKDSNMANCNKLFLDYYQNLKISEDKRKRLMDSKEVLRKRIKNYFKKNHPEYVPEFWIQGSYKMKTLILTKDNECDLDDGIYFKRAVGVNGTTLQTWVCNAVDGATSTTPQHRKKCVRVIYKADYHIDFPIYYFPEDEENPWLAVKNQELEESDPKEVAEWYKIEKRKNAQLKHMVKYFKGWGDHKRNKMPSGLAMTILAAENTKYNERDDISLKDTLIAIQDTLEDNFECIVPATPNDDLFENYDAARKKNFLDNLDDFIKDAKEAVDNVSNQLKASKLWRKHLGDKFPLGADEDVDAKEAALRAISEKVLAGTAYTQRDGSITNAGTGVKNKPHLNYGG